MADWPREEIVAFRWSVSAAAVFAWDLLCTIVPGYRFIWKRPFSRDKVLYFWCQLFGMVGLIVHVCLPRTLKSPEECMKLHHLRFSIFHTSMTVTQLWTLHQTFLLFNKQSRQITIFLAFTLFLSMILQSTGTVFYFQYLEFSGDCNRVGSKMPEAKIAHTVGSLYLQVIVLVMSCIRWTQVAHFGPQLQKPAVKLACIVARDNVIISLLILGFFLCMTIIGLTFGVSQHIWNHSWAWVFGFLNMAPYRMILNLRQAQFESEQHNQAQTFSSSLELTEINLTLSAFDDVSYSGTQSTLDSDSMSTVIFTPNITTGMPSHNCKQ